MSETLESQHAGVVRTLPRALASAWAGYFLFILFTSLHPLVEWRPLSQWSASFVTAPLPPYITRTDITTNLMVYLPLGYLTALLLSRPRRRARAVGLTFLIGLAISFGLESLQQLLPGRIASNLDMVLNVGGTLLGAILSLHHRRLRRAMDRVARWRHAWFRPGARVNLGLLLILLWGLGQFSLLPMPGAGWLDLHLRPLDTAPGGQNPVNVAWFLAVALEMSVLGAFTACLLRPGHYVSAMLLLFLLAFLSKLLTATLLLKLRVVGGVLSLETLLGVFFAFWILLTPLASRHRLALAHTLVVVVLCIRLGQAEYLLLPRVSLLNIMGLAKALASVWPYAALLLLLSEAVARSRRPRRRRLPAAIG